MKEIKILDTSQLSPHPDNRPLGINEEKVDQLAKMMRQNGYDQSKPIKARPHGTGFQIIEGEHRWRAAQKAGIDTVPVFVVEVDDEEALIQLVAGNVQTDSHALDYGYAALKICSEHSKKGYSFAVFADRLGVNRQSLSRAVKGAKVRMKLEQCHTGVTLLESIAILDEIGKCLESDWTWFHDLAVQKDLSKNEVIEISKRIRAIDAAAGTASASVLDITEIKKEVATAKERVFNEKLLLIEGIEQAHAGLKESVTLWKYDLEKNNVIEYEYQPQYDLLSRLKDTSELTRQKVFSYQSAILSHIRAKNKEQAEKDKSYYEDETNEKERQEREKAEWEAFMPVPGTWYQLGRHHLYCGDNRDEAFISDIPKDAAFAFADPPYNAGVDEWDNDFIWEQDYLQDHADIVLVTPGIGNIPELFKYSKMAYKWSLSTWIKNGMTRGALGFGNWMYTAIFSKKESVYQNEQDFNSITIKTSENEGHYHKGRKPSEYMDFLVNKFSQPGQCVIDPFGGSGSTLISCQSTGRVCYMAEKKPMYCKEIMKQYKEIEG